MKAVSWVIVLLGLWEFGDIAALFVPGFGSIKPGVWSHIIVGFFLIIAGAWAALTRQASTARTLHWAAAAAGVWLIVARFILDRPLVAIALLNDILVGALVVALGLWAALAGRRVSR